MSLGANPAMDHWQPFDFHALEQRILARLRHDRRVPWFVLGSALLHGAIVLFVAPPSWLHPEAPVEPPPLSVQLEAAKPKPLPPPRLAPPPQVLPSPPSPATPRRSEPPPAPQPLVQAAATAPANAPVVAAREEPPPRETVTAPPPPAPAITAPAPRVTDDPALLDDYSRQLSDIVSRHKQYPAIARMRGWQGTTELELRVAPDGRILSAKVSRSSGHEILDKQALEMVEQTAKFPPFPQAGREQPVTVRLPVIFRLQ